MGEPFDLKQKQCKSIGCRTHFVNLNFDHYRDLQFSRSNFELAIFQE